MKTMSGEAGMHQSVMGVGGLRQYRPAGANLRRRTLGSVYLSPTSYLVHGADDVGQGM